MKNFSPIAIVGKAFCFPEHIRSDEAFWNVLYNEECVITQIPTSRWPTDELSHTIRSEAGRSVTYAAGVVPDVEKFDAGFFGISPREATKIDPQQRILLMLSHEALENAGIAATEIAGSNCGVYIGMSSIDYGIRHLEDLSSMTMHSMTGNTISIAANRISYIFDLHGPSLAVDTACSSSLVALHTACRALQGGEIQCALVGGVNLLYHPFGFVGFSKAYMISADGRCLPFDAKGTGYVRSEGAAMLVLKPLDVALANGDYIEAVICGSGVNTDGKRKSGLTIPSIDGQTELMQGVLDKIGMSPESIDYVEMHGTGTPVGDPIEAQAVSSVYAKKRSKPLPISSVKANIGHMEPASGMAGLVKALLVMKKREVPAAPFDFEPNPNIDFDNLNIKFVDKTHKLTEKGTVRVAVNSFGFGGANAHVILQSPEEFLQKNHTEIIPAQPEVLPPLFLSARSKKALESLASSYAASLVVDDMDASYDLLYGAATKREYFEKRVAFWQPTTESLVQSLQRYAEGAALVDMEGVCIEQSPLSHSGDVAFVYCGNGSHWIGMAQGLLQYDEDFAQCLREIDALMLKYVDFSLYKMLQDATNDDLENTAITQPLIFAIQVGITHLLEKQGIVPKAVTGHSVGEVVAGYVSGAYDLAQAVKIICARSQCQSFTAGLGRMAAIKLTLEDAKQLLKELKVHEHVFIAGINAPQHLTLSGSEEHLQKVQEYCQDESIYFQLLGLDYAFHSPHMDSIEQKLLDKLKNIRLKATKKCVFVSSVTGTVLEGKCLDAQYWWHNVRKPVLFSSAMDTLMDLGSRIFVEVGPHAILQRYMKDCIKAKGLDCAVFATLSRKNDHPKRILETVLHIELAVPKPKVKKFFPHKGKSVILPNYPWQLEDYTIQYTTECAPEKRRVHPLLGWPLDSVEKTWENVLDPRLLSWLGHHVVGEAVVFPAAGYVEIALAAGKDVFGENPYALEYLDIVAPLVFEENIAQVLRTTLDAGKFKIMARPRLSDNPWMLYATGRIVEQKNTDLPLSVPRANPNVEFLPYAKEDLYAKAHELGLEYGKYFQTIKTLRLNEQGLCADIELDETWEQDYLLAPAALDTCFHALVALVDRQQEVMRRNVSYLPVKIGNVMVLQHAPISQIVVEIERISSQSILANCAMYSADNTLIASALECRFRAVPLLQKRNSQVDAWYVRAYNKELRRIEATPMPSMKGFLEHLPTSKCVHYAEQRVKWLNHTLPLLELLSLAYGIESLHALQQKNLLAFQKALQMPYGKWLVELLLAQGLASNIDDAWTFNTQEVPSAKELWQELASTVPEAMATLLPMGRIGLHLTEALEYPENLHQLYNDVCACAVSKKLRINDPNYSTITDASIKLVQNLVNMAPEGCCVRILEVGAFSWGLAQSLYNSLPTDRFSYTFACTEDEGLQQSQVCFDTYENYDGFLLEEDWPSQTIPTSGPFDIVIVQQCLHSWQNISGAFSYLKSCLLPNGLLLATESYAHWHSNFVNGLSLQWWRAQGQSALLKPEQWQALLKEKGFSNVIYKKEQHAEELEAGSYLLTAQNTVDAIEDIKDETGQALSHVLFVGNPMAAPLLTPLQKDLHDYGITTKYYFEEDSEPYASIVEDFLRVDSVNNTNSFSIVFSQIGAQGADNCTLYLENLRKIACLAHEHQNKSVRLVLITQGAALCAMPNGQQYFPAEAALWGMGRTIMSEFPEINCTLIDLPCPEFINHEGQAQLGNVMLSRLRQEMLYPDGADEIILNEHSRNILMLTQDLEEQLSIISDDTRFCLGVTHPGKLSNLRWFEDTASPLQEGQVEVQVMATGLNFRDVMLALGLLPDDAVENGFAGPTLGLEFSGVVSKVGSAVTSFAIGDAVVGFAPSCFSSHVITDADILAPMPKHWRYEDAASIPTVFFTAYYALKHLANLQKGERLLIHGAAGGVGLAAIQVAKHIGVQIFATAGSDEKRDFLRLQGIEHIFDSRSLDFAAQIHNATEGQGVDVVLNSLAGEAMRRSIDILRPFGRFVELGKRDFVENTAISLRPFKENISYFAFDADQMLTVKPAVSKIVFQEIMQLFEQNIFHMLPIRTFAAEHILDAFRTMQQAQHIGKIVISLRTPPKQCAKIHSTPSWNGQGTWLVTGGLEGFGLATAKWLAKHGVGNLVLISRRGMATPDAQDIIDYFAKNNVHVSIEACNVAEQNAVQDLMDRLQNVDPPLNGIVHSAAVYSDAFLQDLDEDNIAKVVEPKLQGAWNLHYASLGLPQALEYFVLFSSISTTLGNMGQANYVAANAGLESLALLRQSMGLKATCIAWGPIGDVGYLTAHEKVKQNLEKHLGTEVLSAKMALNNLSACLTDQKPVRIVANFDWGTLKRVLPYKATRYTQIFHATKSSYGVYGDSGSLINMRELLAGKSHDDALDIVCEVLTQAIAAVLSLDPQSMGRTASLQSLGMDSLMAVELALGLEQRFGVRLPTMLLQDAPSIEKVAMRIFDKMFTKDKETSAQLENMQELASRHGEVLTEEIQHKLKTNNYKV